jgi:hypothetical protein
MAFVDMITDMSRRGDISEVAETFEGYWTDKIKYPWHTVYLLLEKRSLTRKPNADLSNTLLLLREAVFGALGLTSLSLALDASTDEIVKRIIKQSSWKEAQRSVRQYASDIVSDMIGKGEIKYLTPVGLATDGLGFLIPALRQAQLEEFKKAKPKVVNGKLDLKRMSNSVVGRGLLRQLAITENELDETDNRTKALLESYEHMLVDIEISEEAATIPASQTEQVAIGGGPIKASSARKPARGTESRRVAVQTNLTEYVGHPEEGVASKHTPMPHRSKSSSRRSQVKRRSPKSTHK